VISQREHLIDKAPALIAARAPALSASAAVDMITEVATEAAIWGCTTCGWCEEGCPVSIEHIQRIVDMRRHLTLMESKFPQQVTNAFRGIENQGNPWGLAAEKRAEWAKDSISPRWPRSRSPTISTFCTGSDVPARSTIAISA
jgi:Fe-S oxidoreductase